MRNNCTWCVQRPFLFPPEKRIKRTLHFYKDVPQSAADLHQVWANKSQREDYSSALKGGKVSRPKTAAAKSGENCLQVPAHVHSSAAVIKRSPTQNIREKNWQTAVSCLINSPPRRPLESAAVPCKRISWTSTLSFLTEELRSRIGHTDKILPLTKTFRRRSKYLNRSLAADRLELRARCTRHCDDKRSRKEKEKENKREDEPG